MSHLPADYISVLCEREVTIQFQAQKRGCKVEL
jgi:hypothetical protein